MQANFQWGLQDNCIIPSMYVTFEHAWRADRRNWRKIDGKLLQRLLYLGHPNADSLGPGWRQAVRSEVAIYPSSFHLFVFEVVNISFESNIRFANAVRFASATTTSGAYSTSKICLIATQIRFAWRSDQKLKSSGSLSSVSESSGLRMPLLLVSVTKEVVNELLLPASDNDVVALQESGIRDGSESKHSGTMRIRLRRTLGRSICSGRSTVQ